MGSGYKIQDKSLGAAQEQGSDQQAALASTCLLLHGLLQLCVQAQASGDKLGAASSFLTAHEVLQVHNREHIFGFSGEARVRGFTILASLRRGWEQLLRISPDASFQRQTV